jgi:hypothetical protein
MAGAGFQSVAKLCAQILNPVLADRGVSSEDCHNKNGHTADCQNRSLNLRADCHRPELSAWFVLGLRAGVGNPQRIRRLIAKEIILWWQSAELERGGQQYSEIQPPPFYIEMPPV